MAVSASRQWELIFFTPLLGGWYSDSVSHDRENVQGQLPVAKEQVLEQIQRLIDSELFRSSELQRRLLKYLAEKSLAGEADQLKEYTVGTEGIGKPASYDPRRDSTIRLQISKLRQKVAEYYVGAGQNDPVVIDRRRAISSWSPRCAGRWKPL